MIHGMQMEEDYIPIENPSDIVAYELVRLSSSITVPPSCFKTLSHRIDNLIEMSHLPEDARIEESHLPLLNPYSFYHRDHSFSSSIRRLPVKEYIQGTKMNQCGLKATQQEQYVTLKVPTYFIHH